jgi:ectoine hydroxylase-related dioxygenase (phytanoyl-CoA dioxygenase family)
VVAPTLNKGDILIYDYRTCHRGTANVSTTVVRPMLYLMYARPWFAEHVNFGSESLFPSSLSTATTTTKQKKVAVDLSSSEVVR